MKKRIFSLFLIALLIFMGMPISAHATENEDVTITTFDDGSYLEIVITEGNTRASNSKSGQKTLSYKNSNGEVEWKAVLSASFTYTGSSATCTSASCTVTTYSSDWYVVSKSTTRSGNTATTQLTMGEKYLGVTISKPSYTITLSCSNNGTLS